MLDEYSLFSEWAEVWMKRNLVSVAYGRKIATQSQMQHLNEFIGNIPISKVKMMDLDELLIDRATINPNTGKPMSKSYLKEICRVAKAVFQYAIFNCDDPFLNPAEKLSVPKNAPTKKVRALTEAEQRWVFEMPHRIRCGSLLMLFCGLRSGELLALTWNDIDFEKKSVTVNKTASKSASNRFQIKHSTKNGKTRIVPIPDLIIPELMKYNNSRTSIYITHQKDGRLHTPSSWKKLWESYLKNLNRIYGLKSKKSKYDPAGLSFVIDKINPHMLRHTYATMLYNAGVDVLTASKLLGHSDIQTTLKIYTELREQTMLKSIEKYEDYLCDCFSVQISRDTRPKDSE